MSPILFQIGPFTLQWYGVFIVGGAMLAAYLSTHYARRAGENPDHIWNLLAWTLIVGIIGARAYHVFSSPASGGGWEHYRQYPLDAINFWNGGFRGLGIYGGLVGGVLAIVFYTWRNRLDLLKYLDMIAPNVPIAQALGRMGNFVNQELYGPSTQLPWAFHINPHYPCQTPPNLPPDIQPCASASLTQQSLDWYANHGYHPTFFYEAGWSLLSFALIAWLIRRYGDRLRRGDGILLYLVAYPLGRFWVEMFRPDAWTIGSLATAQWVAVGAVILGIVILIVRHLRWHPATHPTETLSALRASS